MPPRLFQTAKTHQQYTFKIEKNFMRLVRISQWVFVRIIKIASFIWCLKIISALKKKMLENHFMKNHLKMGFHCYFCAFSTNSKGRILLHEKRKHGPKEMKTFLSLNSSENIECEICGKVLKHQASFREHNLRFHEKRFQFPCKECEMKFVTRAELRWAGHEWKTFKKYSPFFNRSHEENRHLEKLLICETCGKNCGNFKALKLHQLTHLERKFSCFICEKKFKLKCRLECHIRW